jgi:hypothetical protein
VKTVRCFGWSFEGEGDGVHASAARSSVRITLGSCEPGAETVGTPAIRTHCIAVATIAIAQVVRFPKDDHGHAGLWNGSMAKFIGTTIRFTAWYKMTSFVGQLRSKAWAFW